ncbi:TolC family protein [Chitinophaga sp. sic0106]|uniref:TolC family protein n=1 Tax=Chitinophaga sp. sic0106 TaxID=2854785 RepID=UPI001C4699D6|nr:TolC family protein [Chitinophaga sp. sic0106]MBV7532777.1 TolC family protein [Chitinophaga sp. sic0106]
MNKQPLHIRKGLYVLALATGVSACSVPKHITTPPAVAIPETTVTDTLDIKSFAQVFNDPHLKSLIDTAMAANFDLQAASQRVIVAQSQLRMAKNAWLPTVNGVISAGADRYGDYTLNGVGNYDTNLSPNIDKDQRIPTSPTPEFFVGFRSSWEIDLWGKVRAQKDASLNRYLASTEGRRLLSTQVVAGVATMYYDLVALDHELKIIHRNIGLQEAAVATVEVQKAGGRATELAVQQFKAQLLSTKALENNIKQQIVATENQLNALLGRLPQPIQRTVDTTNSIPPAIHKGIPVTTLLRRPDIQQAERNLAATQADVKAARAAFFPSLTVTPYAGFNAFKAGLLFQPASIAWGALGGLTTPIFNQKQLQSQFNINKAEAMTAFYRYQQTIVDGYAEVSSVISKVENEQATWQLKSEEVAVLRDAVSTSNLLFTTGYANYLEVITAQKSVLEAELTLVTTRRNVYQGMITLYRSLGGN